MTTHEAIKYTLGMSDNLVKTYTEDLSDKDILIQPFPTMNCIAWQLGHLISSEYSMMEDVKPGVSPKLPQEFIDLHSRDQALKVSTDKYATKSEYLSLFDKQREATLKILDDLTEDDLNKDGPESVKSMAPTLRDAMQLQGVHTLMHVGQFVAVRRQLDKPVTI